MSDWMSHFGLLYPVCTLDLNMSIPSCLQFILAEGHYIVHAMQGCLPAQVCLGKKLGLSIDPDVGHCTVGQWRRGSQQMPSRLSSRGH